MRFGFHYLWDGVLGLIRKSQNISEIFVGVNYLFKTF